MRSKSSGGGLVYSTDSGRMCPDCRHAIALCACRISQAVAATDGVVRVLLESKGRGGKSVTVIRGVALAPAALVLLARQLRSACGSGGTVKDAVIEIQGDHRDLVTDLLTKQGWRVKRAGT